MQEYTLTDEGRNYLKYGLPEMRLIELLMSGPVDFTEAKEKVENFSIALQWAKKHGWVKIENNKLALVKNPKNVPEYEALKKLADGDHVESRLLDVLVQRKLIEKQRETAVKKAEKLAGQEVANLTEDLIKTKYWKQVKLKPYNVELAGTKIYPGKTHLLSFYIQKIRNIFFDLGFKEARGPLLESSFWNFDALYQPQDHPAREMADTFYMKTPESCKLPAENVVNEVREAHEKGGNTGSSGWGYKWNREVAKKAVMRTHATAVSVRELSKLKPPAKVFCIGRVFRNETLDYKHLPEFTQVEGIVVDENVTFRDLLGYLKEFYTRMGFKKIRFRPAYFPYTEMSAEPEVYFEEKKEWIELGGSGIFRPEVTQPLGIDVPVLAWGLGLERTIALKHGINDVRNFYCKNDLKLLREINMW